MKIFGVDFTCAPRKAKPITVAAGTLSGKTLKIGRIERLESFSEFEAFLRTKGPWIGGFDFPFSLPRELVNDLQWPNEWPALLRFCRDIPRVELRSRLDAYRATRPVGRKYAHRATDLPAGSSSPMKLVNPPVALMFHEGAPRLHAAGVHVPALFEGDRARVALEAYPGLYVRGQLGLRASYKSDTRSEWTRERRRVRRKILDGLASGKPLGIKVSLASFEKQLLADGSGDLLDAVICAAQAAWASARPGYGLPPDVDPLEGWIVSA